MKLPKNSSEWNSALVTEPVVVRFVGGSSFAGWLAAGWLAGLVGDAGATDERDWIGEGGWLDLGCCCQGVHVAYLSQSVGILASADSALVHNNDGTRRYLRAPDLAYLLVIFAELAVAGLGRGLLAAHHEPTNS